MDPVPFTVAAVVASALVGAVLALWRRQVLTDRKNEAREVDAAVREGKAAARCEREIGNAVERIQFLENRSYEDQNERLDKCMEILRQNAHAFERIVELEKTRQSGSGTHPIIKGASP